MARTHEPVAVLGIGAMGHGMAASALRAGIPTIVWNRRMEATRELAELGGDPRARTAGRNTLTLTRRRIQASSIGCPAGDVAAKAVRRSVRQLAVRGCDHARRQRTFAALWVSVAW